MQIMVNISWQSRVLIAIVACCIGSSAHAAAIVAGIAGTGSLLKLNYSNFPGSNGEFGVFISTSTPNLAYANANLGALGKEDFRTFCVQLNEGISNNQEVRVASLGTVTATTDPDKVLTKSAAWLFREYNNLRNVVSAVARYKGNIPDAGVTYNYNSFDATNNDLDPNLMQMAMWSLMGWADTDIAGAVGGIGNVKTTVINNKYMKAVSLNSGAINDLIYVAGTHVGGVRIMNLVAGNTQRQDMVWVDDSITEYINEVPEPSTLALFGIGILGAVCYRRRRVSVAV